MPIQIAISTIGFYLQRANTKQYNEIIETRCYACIQKAMNMCVNAHEQRGRIPKKCKKFIQFIIESYARMQLRLIFSPLAGANAIAPCFVASLVRTRLKATNRFRWQITTDKNNNETQTMRPNTMRTYMRW